MIVTELSRRALRVRREQRALTREGWELCGEPLWEIVRGNRWQEHIVDARPSADGKGVWIRTDKNAAAQKSNGTMSGA